MDRRRFMRNLAIPLVCGVVGDSPALGAPMESSTHNGPELTPTPNVETFEMNISGDLVTQFRSKLNEVLVAVGQLRQQLQRDPRGAEMPLLRIRDWSELPTQTIRFAVYGREVLRTRVGLLDSIHDLKWFSPIKQHLEQVTRRYFPIHFEMADIEDRDLGGTGDQHDFGVEDVQTLDPAKPG
jgi:hypothetical protein